MTYKHPSRNKIMSEDFFFIESSCVVSRAGTGTNRITLLKKTCSDPMIMHDFLLWSSHLPGGWHMLIQPTSDHTYQIVMSAMET